MKKMRYFNKLMAVGFCTLFLSTAITSCINDDGNYDYVEVPEISIQNIPETVDLIAYVDHYKISPKFVSSTEGEIKPGDSNYTVRYRFGRNGMGAMTYNEAAGTRQVWLDFTPTSGFDLDEPMEYSTGSYQLWVTITDNRTNTVTSKQFYINISSATYEGWMVLCNEGTEERARLDMVSLLPGNKKVPIHDIAAGLPTLHHASCIQVWHQQSTPGDQSYIFTHEGAYELDAESFEGDPDLEFKKLQFAFEPEENIIKLDNFAGPSPTYSIAYQFCFGETGNAYAVYNGSYGSAFSFPINTTIEGNDPEFRVAPYCGYSWVRPYSGAYGCYVLFYDIDNKRFMFYEGRSAALKLNVIPDPSGDAVNLFSYTTGKDFVFMQSTRRSNGLVYTILQDPASGKRSIYGINLGGSGYAQELYIPEVSAPQFEQATQFAFDSRFPLLFYSVGSKLYCYNLGTLQTKEMETGLGANEEITKLKFNLFTTADYDQLINQSEEFMNMQYQLVVGSYDSSDTNGGKLSIYDVDGSNNSISLAEQYTGFAKIVDVIYRERGN